MKIATGFKVSTAMIVVLASTACANLDSIYRHNHLSAKGQTEFVDAKQRAIIAAPIQKFKYVTKSGKLKPEYVKTFYRFCSEPAPDVFSVHATSASGNVSKDPTAGFAAAFGMSSAEAGATIERTQVINLLRESMFRTCERYMNGALSDSQMNIQTARDQRMMVATLAIEQLTGVVKRKPTILSSSASAEIGADAKKYIDKIVEAEATVETLETAVEKATTENKAAQDKYSALNKKPDGAGADAKPFCDAAREAAAAASSTTTATSQATSTTPVTTVTTTPTATVTQVSAPPAAPVLAGATSATQTPTAPPPATPPATTPTPSTASPEELTACNEAKSDADAKAGILAEKNAELAEAKKVVEKLEGRLKYLKDTVLHASATGSGDSGNSPLSTSQIQTVSNVVKTIAQLAFDNQSELSLTCVEILKGAVTGASPKTRQACQGLINAQAQKALITAVSQTYSPNSAALTQTGFKRIDTLRAIVKNLSGAKARRILTNPPNTSIQTFVTRSQINALNAADARSNLDILILGNRDQVLSDYDDWFNALTSP